jgi:hypothetical protein
MRIFSQSGCGELGIVRCLTLLLYAFDKDFAEHGLRGVVHYSVNSDWRAFDDRPRSWLHILF